MKFLLASLMALSFTAVTPQMVGVKICNGGEQGYWMPYTITEADSLQHTHLYVSRFNVGDPTYFICRVHNDQRIQVLPLEG